MSKKHYHTLYKAIDEISTKMSNQQFEILFVNDGSKDNTLALLKELSEKDSKVKYISFSRNFGKEAAIYAGLQYAIGEYIAVMDADIAGSSYFVAKHV